MPETLRKNFIELTFKTYRLIPNFHLVELWAEGRSVATMMVPADEWMNPEKNKELMEEIGQWYVQKRNRRAN